MSIHESRIVLTWSRYACLRSRATGRRVHNRLVWAMTLATAAMILWQIGHLPGMFNGADLLALLLALNAAWLIMGAVNAGRLGDDWPHPLPAGAEQD